MVVGNFTCRCWENNCFSIKRPYMMCNKAVSSEPDIATFPCVKSRWNIFLTIGDMRPEYDQQDHKTYYHQHTIQDLYSHVCSIACESHTKTNSFGRNIIAVVVVVLRRKKHEFFHVLEKIQHHDILKQLQNWWIDESINWTKFIRKKKFDGKCTPGNCCVTAVLRENNHTPILSNVFRFLCPVFGNNHILRCYYWTIKKHCTALYSLIFVGFFFFLKISNENRNRNLVIWSFFKPT